MMQPSTSCVFLRQIGTSVGVIAFFLVLLFVPSFVAGKPHPFSYNLGILGIYLQYSYIIQPDWAIEMKAVPR